MTEERFLVTGSSGCIGSWVIKLLGEAGIPVVGADIDPEPRRLAQLVPPESLPSVSFVKLDITDLDGVLRTLEGRRVNRVIHLAALQIPFCRADPARGALVNVVGTVNIFEAARRLGVRSLVYASSVAVFGPPNFYRDAAPLPDDAPQWPETLYGVYKQANEGTARLYWQDYGVPSVGLRPWAVYGVGRDQGLTSDPTKAIKAAVLGMPFKIRFGGRLDLQYAEDVARIFIAAARRSVAGAPVFNIRGNVLSVEEFLAELAGVLPESRGLIGWEGPPLPLPPELDDRGLREFLGGQVPHTPLAEGIRQTAETFRALEAAGRLDPRID
ncbi:MAG: epimerase [Chloroflexota bacterium]